ncbi:MAG: 50S ribosomal protein L21 [Patescibacteria group bacterium]|nr:50S ribosomal protein L21 [Patescibacteria group bacterium]
MLAVIKTGGKQYIVQKGDKIKIEKLPLKEKAKVSFEAVLLISDEKGKKVEVGDPILKQVKVEGKVLKQGRSKKVIIIKQIPKKRHKLKKGHRQPFSEVEITKVATKE